MHPEVVSDKPGRCPQCGMQLVLESEAKNQDIQHHDDQNTAVEASLKNYMPLIVVILLILLITGVLTIQDVYTDGFELESTLVYFMTGFFIVFAGFKLLDIKGFAEGYSTYDLLAKRFFGYGYLYPFLELAFGISMLVGYHPAWLLWAEFGLMTFSGIGVAIKIAKKEKFQCACLGTVLKVPLTYVTLIEDFGMALLALILLSIQ